MQLTEIPQGHNAHVFSAVNTVITMILSCRSASQEGAKAPYLIQAWAFTQFDTVLVIRQ